MDEQGRSAGTAAATTVRVPLSDTPQERLSDFRRWIALPAFITEATARQLMITALLTAQWRAVLGGLLEGEQLREETAESIDTWVAAATADRSEWPRPVWQDITDYVSDAAYGRRQAALLSSSSPPPPPPPVALEELRSALASSMPRDKQATLLNDDVVLAKAYVLAFHPQWTQAFASVFAVAPYDTQQAFAQFAKTHAQPHAAALIALLSRVR